MQAEAKNFVVAVQDYDGLEGKVLQWTYRHGNANHDPAILAWVLDPDGEELGRGFDKLGSASNFASWLKEMGRASFPLVDPSAYEVLKDEARAIAAKKDLGRILAELRKKAESETDKAKEEAKDLLARLLGFAEHLVARAEKKKTADPEGALALFKEIAAQFRGDAVGDEAQETYGTLKSDKAFQREIKAGAILKKILALKDEIRPDRPADSTSNRKVVASIQALMAVLRKNFRDTAVCARAEEIVKGLGG